jgi:hypothetical protein
MRGIAAIAVVLLAVTACKKTAPPPNEAWMTADYVRAGIPASDHPWTAAELQAAVDVLARESAKQRDTLPRHGGVKTAKIFAKLVEQPPRDPDSMAIAQRIETHLARFNALNQAAKLYSPEPTDPAPREMIELFGALMREAATVRPQFAPFLASFAADDPTLNVRKAGLAKFDTGMAGLMLGAVMVASDARSPDADRRAMLQFVLHAVPVLFVNISPEGRSELRATTERIVESTSGDLQRDASRVLAAMK